MKLSKGRKLFFLYFYIPLFFNIHLYSDSLTYNTFNNHGVLGLINTPTARFYDESTYGFTFYDGTPDQKFTMTSYPYDWLEASFFYTNIQGKPYPGYEWQDYKDKGFNFKVRLREESGSLPAIAIGINDIAGTGYYSSEYIVGSYGLGNLDMHFGFGWGNLNGKEDVKNPLTFIHDSFSERPTTGDTVATGGTFEPGRYFSGETFSPFFGIAYAFNEKFLLKFERDTTKTDGVMPYENPDSDFSFGLDFNANKNWSIGLSAERNNFFSLRFSYKRGKEEVPRYTYEKIERNKDDDEYTHFRRTLESNGIGVNEMFETKDRKIVGLELSGLSHPSIDIVEEIIMSARNDSGLEQEVVANYKIGSLEAIKNYENEFQDSSRQIFSRYKDKKWWTSSRINVRPFIAAREAFLKISVLAENDFEYSFTESFQFSSNIKYSLWDNFDDLYIPPPESDVPTVRSDVKDYLRNFNSGPIIGRAQLDYYLSPQKRKKSHFMFTAGILEEMFSGYGFEYLYFDPEKPWAAGFEIFDVTKRDYELQFGLSDYQNTIANANFYYRNYDLIPFDAKISAGEYLAGDKGVTFELSRSYLNGMQFGVFATFTDVSREEFGEGSFDKGIFFNIPIYKNLASYSWRPLTKDPGQKLLRRNNLHDLLVKFKSYNY